MSTITLSTLPVANAPSIGTNPTETDTSRLFGSPPTEIGRVRSAFSSLMFEKEGMRFPRRLLYMGVGAGATVLAVALLINLHGSLSPGSGSALALIAGGLVAGILWLDTATPAICTYVGETGIARLKRSAPDGRVRVETLLFNDATSLEKTHRSHMEGEHFLFPEVDEEMVTFLWKDAGGKTVFRIKGTNYHKDTLAEPMTAYLFGRAAEESWTDHLMRQGMAAIGNGRAVRFPLPGERGALELNGDTLTCQLASGTGSIPWERVDKFYFQDHDLILVPKTDFTLPNGEKDLDIHFRHFPNELFFHRLCETLTGLKGILHHEHAQASKTLTDSKTGLAGAMLFRDRLRMELNRHKRENHTLMVMVFKFDNLVHVNHEYANRAGSEAAREVGRRLSKLVRDSDTAARLTGSEFAALLPEISDPEFPPRAVDKYTKTLEETINLPLGRVIPDFAIGTALFPRDGETASDLLRSARKNARKKWFEPAV